VIVAVFVPPEPVDVTVIVTALELEVDVAGVEL